MKKNEKFPWPIEEGTAVDYVDSTLILAIKDSDWNDAQLASAKEPFCAMVCETAGLIIFLLEGGPLDASDFYFNIQECDEAEKMLGADNLDVQALLIDGDNVIREVKSATLSKEKTKTIRSLLERQNSMEFMPGEYDVNVEGMQSAFEPAELARYEKCSFELR